MRYFFRLELLFAIMAASLLSAADLSGLRSGTDEERWAAAGRLAEQDAGTTLPALIAAIESATGFERTYLVRAAGLIGAEAGAAVPAVAETLRAAGNDHAQVLAAAAALAAIGGDDAVAALAGVIEDAAAGRLPAHTGAAATGALAAAGDLPDAALKALIGALSIEGIDNIENAEFCAGAAWLLGTAGVAAADAVPALTKLLSCPPVAEIQRRRSHSGFRHSLGQRTDPRHVHRQAILALGMIGTDARPALSGLAELLHDEDWLIRRLAAEAIGRIGPEYELIRDALAVAAADDNPQVRYAVDEARGQIVQKTVMPPGPVEHAVGKAGFERGAVTVRLRNGVRCRESETDLELYLEVEEGKWLEPVLGYAWLIDDLNQLAIVEGGNTADHEGRLLSAVQSNGTFVLKTAMNINPDWYASLGGRGEYVLEFELDGDVITGTYRGTFDERPVEGVLSGNIRREPWPAPVSEWREVARGEHPRLYFRKSDIPRLRKMAGTPGGKMVLANLREILVGPFTPWHAAGYGFLYQITADPRYAELAGTFVERLLSGARDKLDGRYWWCEPKVIRQGSMIEALALAYDLCYNAWDENYRRRIAGILERELHAFIIGGGEGFDSKPERNWYGVWVGTAGIVALAIQGDERLRLPPRRLPVRNQDTAQWQAFLARADRYISDDAPEDISAWALRFTYRRMQRYFSERGGWGDHGYFWEGQHYSRLPGNKGCLPFFLASRSAAGLDFDSHPECGGQWIMLRWLYNTVGENGEMRYIRNNEAGARWDHYSFDNVGGEFAKGAGICNEAYLPAVKWFYRNVVHAKGDRPCNIGVYPHHAVLAYLHWPFGLEERNPAEVLPSFLYDRRKGYFVFRKKWQSADDPVAMFHLSHDYSSLRTPQIMVWGLGAEMKGEPVMRWHPIGDLLNWRGGRVLDVAASADGVTVVAAEFPVPPGGQILRHAGSFLVDWSGKSGATGLIAVANFRESVQQEVDEEERARQAEALQRMPPQMREMMEARLKSRQPQPFTPQVASDVERFFQRGAEKLRTTVVASGDGFRFVLMTLHAGEHPSVSTSGAGLDTVVNIGERTLRFDGTRIVVESIDSGFGQY